MIRNHLALSALLVLTLGPLACASRGDADLFEKRTRVQEAQKHTGGQALHERVTRMQRTQRDLMHLQRTLETLRRHRYDDQIQLLGGFVRPYLKERVAPLLSDRDESWHPELVPLDANLLFAEAAVLGELRDRRGVDRVANTLEKRFARMDSLIVEYPRGEQNSLGRGLALLREDARGF